MELLGVEGKEEVEALAILNKFSADHCQVSYLREKMQVIEGRLPKTISFILGNEIWCEFSSEERHLGKPPRLSGEVIFTAGMLNCLKQKRGNQTCLYSNADGKFLSFALQGEERRLGLLQAAVTREERLERSGLSGGDFESYFHFYACLNIIHTSMS